jgi:hypothetical protein
VAFLKQIAAKDLLRQTGLVLSLIISLGAWAYASPVGSDPDGNFHLASIWCGSGYIEGQCEPPSVENMNAVPKVVKVPKGVALANGCRPGAPAYAAECTNALILDKNMPETSYNNEGRLYPNGYYWVASNLVSDDIASTVQKIRLMNIMVFVLLIIAVNLILPAGIKKSVNLTHLVFLMPLGYFLVASNNPSSWAISGLGTFWAFLYGFLTIDGNNRKVIAAGIFTVISATMATQARADSAAFVIVISLFVTVIAFVQNLKIRQQGYRRLILPLTLSIIAYLTFSSSGQSRAISSGLLGDESIDRDSLMIFLWNLTRLPALIAGIFGYPGGGGGLGWLDVAMPQIVSLGMLFLSGYLIAKSAGNRNRTEIICLFILLGIIIAMPIAILQQDGAIVGELVQSRYLLPSLMALSGLYFAKSSVLDDDGNFKSAKFLTLFVLVIAYLVALHTTIRRYVTGNDVMDWNLNRAREWWWEDIPLPMTVLSLGSFAYLTLVTLVLFESKRMKSTFNG